MRAFLIWVLFFISRLFGSWTPDLASVGGYRLFTATVSALPSLWIDVKLAGFDVGMSLFVRICGVVITVLGGHFFVRRIDSLLLHPALSSSDRILSGIVWGIALACYFSVVYVFLGIATGLDPRSLKWGVLGHFIGGIIFGQFFQSYRNFMKKLYAEIYE